MNNNYSDNNIELLINISKNIKYISLLTVLCLIIIILTNFLPMINQYISIIGKLIALILLLYIIKFNILNINNILSKIKNIFLDPDKNEFKNIIILTFIFTFCISLLFIKTIHSLIYNNYTNQNI